MVEKKMSILKPSLDTFVENILTEVVKSGKTSLEDLKTHFGIENVVKKRSPAPHQSGPTCPKMVQNRATKTQNPCGKKLASNSTFCTGHTKVETVAPEHGFIVETKKLVISDWPGHEGYFITTDGMITDKTSIFGVLEGSVVRELTDGEIAMITSDGLGYVFSPEIFGESGEVQETPVEPVVQEEIPVEQVVHEDIPVVQETPVEPVVQETPVEPVVQEEAPVIQEIPVPPPVIKETPVKPQVAPVKPVAALVAQPVKPAPAVIKPQIQAKPMFVSAPIPAKPAPAKTILVPGPAKPMGVIPVKAVFTSTIPTIPTPTAAPQKPVPLKK